MLNRLLILSVLAGAPFSAICQTVTRFEQTDSHISYTGTWYPSTDSLESGGTATLTNAKGAQAVIFFTGTGITWLGTSDGYSGLCYVTLDGVQTTVDTSNPASATYYQQKLFSVSNLAPGLHHLTIEVIHQRDDTTQGSWIWIDAVEVQNGTLVSGPPAAGAGLAQQTDPSVNYSGHWFQTAGAQYSGGSVNSAVDPGSSLDFTFNGTGVSWLAYRDEYSGTAQVYIDGALQNTVDTYKTPAAAQSIAWSVGGLSPGVHKLTITATGTHSASSGGSWVWVDGFQVSGSATAGPPAINAGGFVSAASFMPAPNNQIAPGQIISIFGKNFTASSGANAGTIPLPTQLAPENTSVTACGRALPLYAVYSGQINAQLPSECLTAGTLTATISVNGQTSTQTFTVAPAAPGIFTADASGTGAGIITHANGSLVTSANPATAGETVVIYATGLGPTNPSFATGAAADRANVTVQPVSVTIGGSSATVMYSGLTQSLVGLYQVNAVVPAGLTGNQPVIITVASMYSSRSGVTISLH